MEVVRVVGCEEGSPMEVAVLRTFGARLKGLLGTSPEAGPVLLVRCGSIHTWGMAYPIDVALVDGSSRVVASWRSLAPGRIVGHPDAVMALERPESGLWWPDVGDVLFSVPAEALPAEGGLPGRRPRPERGVGHGARMVAGMIG